MVGCALAPRSEHHTLPKAAHPCTPVVARRTPWTPNIERFRATGGREGSRNRGSVLEAHPPSQPCTGHSAGEGVGVENNRRFSSPTSKHPPNPTPQPPNGCACRTDPRLRDPSPAIAAPTPPQPSPQPSLRTRALSHRRHSPPQPRLPPRPTPISPAHPTSPPPLPPALHPTTLAPTHSATHRRKPFLPLPPLPPPAR